MFEKQKKGENMVEIKDTVRLHQSPSIKSFRHRNNSLLRRADARGSAGIFYHIRRISLVCGSGIVIDVRK